MTDVLTEPVYGFRRWWLHHDLALCSPIVGKGRWPWGLTTTAECRIFLGYEAQKTRMPRIVPEHEAPDWQCWCGLHAYTALGLVPKLRPMMVVGAVVGWGRVIHHGDEGWRAQHARVVAFAHAQAGLYQAETESRLLSLAEIWGVPVVDPEMLPVIAAEHGRRAA